MNLLFILFLVILLLILLLFTVALTAVFTFNTDRGKMDLTLLWLYPLLKVVVTKAGVKPILKVYIFNKSIFKKALKPGKKSTGNNIELIKQVKPTDISVNTSYGFRDPFITGIACGAISMASQFVDIAHLQQQPDFAADKDYIHVDAAAKINLGSALVNLYKHK